MLSRIIVKSSKMQSFSSSASSSSTNPTPASSTRLRLHPSDSIQTEIARRCCVETYLVVIVDVRSALPIPSVPYMLAPSRRGAANLAPSALELERGDDVFTTKSKRKMKLMKKPRAWSTAGGEMTQVAMRRERR